jgi:hypothetical protein
MDMPQRRAYENQYFKMRRVIWRGDSTTGAVSDLIRGVSESSSRCKFPWILDGSAAHMDNAPSASVSEMPSGRSWKWTIPGLVMVALFAALANPPDNGVTSPRWF